MANDNVRSGPAGATKQASKLGHRIIKLNAVAGASTVGDAQALAGWVASTTGSVSFEADRSAGSGNVLLGFPGSWEQLTFGGEWIVGKIWLQVTENFVDTNQTVEVGIYSLSGGTVSAIDTDAICTSQSIDKDKLQAGATYEIPMDGVGAGLEYYKTAAPNNKTVSMKLGLGTAQFSDGNADKTGQLQFLGVKFPQVSKDGKAVCYVELIPVSGPDFKN